MAASTSGADLPPFLDLRAAFEVAVGHHPEPMLLVSAPGTICGANRAFSRAFGWTRDELVGSSLLDRVEGTPDEVLAYLRLCAASPDFLPGALSVRRLREAPVQCRTEAWVVRARAGDDPAVLVLRLLPKHAAASRFIRLTREIADLNAEIARRRVAEREAAAALAGQTALQERLALLADATKTLLASLTLTDVVEAVGRLTRRLLPADAHAVWHYDAASDAWRIAWQQDLSDRFVGEIRDWVGRPATSAPFDTPIAVPDVASVPLLAERQRAYEVEGIRSLLAIPLRIRGHNHGTAVVYYRRRHEFSEPDLRVAGALGDLASSALTTVELYESQARARAEAELAERRARFLASAGAALGASLDYEHTLTKVAQLAVPEIADWCAVDIVVDGAPKRVAVAHVDPAKVELARSIQERYPSDPASPYGIHAVLRTGAPVMMEHIPEDLLQKSARDAVHLELLRDLGLTSYMCVPLLAQGRAIGVLTLVSAESGRAFADEDLRFALDVASRAALAVENARAYEEARRANQLKDEFLATLSHELRTPLNAILGYTRMLRSGSVPEERRGHALHVVERNASALNQIVEDVLDVSRIVAGKIRLDVQTVDLPKVLEDAIATVTPAAEAKGVRLQSVLDPRASPVTGDPDRLQQVVWNLLSNAVKFTPRGGRVQVRLERVNSHVEISISDTGVGIAPDFLTQLFEPFRQADSRSTREHGGLGLGLAICRHLVEAHGGSISASSDGLGRGATFRVRLPSMIVHAERHPDARRVHPRATTSAPVPLQRKLAGIHVLAVDDEPDALTLVVEVLEAAGARVSTAVSAALALEIVARDKPDVIVTDIGMPYVDGFEFLARLRQSDDPAARAVPTAALTAYARSEDRIRVLQSGFQMHLAKPIDPSELVAAIYALASQTGERVS